MTTSHVIIHLQMLAIVDDGTLGSLSLHLCIHMTIYWWPMITLQSILRVIETRLTKWLLALCRLLNSCPLINRGVSLIRYGIMTIVPRVSRSIERLRLVKLSLKRSMTHQARVHGIVQRILVLETLPHALSAAGIYCIRIADCLVYFSYVTIFVVYIDRAAIIVLLRLSDARC